MSNGFGPLLVAHRAEHNLTQAELADLLGTSQNRVSKWEKGDGFPKEPAIRKAICDLLAYPVAQMETGYRAARLRPLTSQVDQLAGLLEQNVELSAQIADLRETLDEVLRRLDG